MKKKTDFKVIFYDKFWMFFLESQRDISSLARAAVSGDESALDMFNWKRGSKSKMGNSPFGQQESLSFFVGGASGKVHFKNLARNVLSCEIWK